MLFFFPGIVRKFFHQLFDFLHIRICLRQEIHLFQVRNQLLYKVYIYQKYYCNYFWYSKCSFIGYYFMNTL